MSAKNVYSSLGNLMEESKKMYKSIHNYEREYKPTEFVEDYIFTKKNSITKSYIDILLQNDKNAINSLKDIVTDEITKYKKELDNNMDMNGGYKKYKNIKT